MCYCKTWKAVCVVFTSICCLVKHQVIWTVPFVRNPIGTGDESVAVVGVAVVSIGFAITETS